MKPINIDEVTPEKLIGEVYETELPEFYLLKTVRENSPWHVNQRVFDHVVKVYEALLGLLAESNLSPERKRLLKIATLLHDIAKPDTAVTDATGMVRCPEHELIGASRVGLFAERFELNLVETKRVTEIVRYHGFISEILNLIIANGNLIKYQQIFKEVVGEVETELLTLMRADLMGSDLKKTSPEGFNARIKILDKLRD